MNTAHQEVLAHTTNLTAPSFVHVPMRALLQQPEQLLHCEPTLDAYGWSAAQRTNIRDTLLEDVRKQCSELALDTVLTVERTLYRVWNQLIAASGTHPAATKGEVVQVERRSRRIVVVRIQAEHAVPYQLGQRIEVSPFYAPQQWQPAYPALPSNEAGQIELHLHHEDLLATLRPGDTCRLTPGIGPALELPEGRDLLLLSHGTSLAPLRAIIMQQLMNAEPPRTHLFLGAEYPGEQYELQTLWGLASAAPWLFITPVIAHDTDPWWVAGTEYAHPPRGLHLPKVGCPASVATAYGRWRGYHIILAGNSEECAASQTTLAAHGVDPDSIHVLDTSPRYFFE